MGVWSRSGFANRASTAEDCFEAGDRARLLVGRWLWRSDEVGIDSGMFSDIVYNNSSVPKEQYRSESHYV